MSHSNYFKILIITCFGLNAFAANAQSTSDKVYFYISESNIALSANRHKEACDFARFAFELSNFSLKGTEIERAAQKVRQDNCKVFEANEKSQSEKFYSEAKQEQLKKHEACKKNASLFNKSANECAVASNYDRCMSIKLGRETYQELRSCP